MSQRSEATNTGIGVAGVVQIVFLILKLCKVIDWSWWFVMLPTLIEIGLLVVILTIGAVVVIAESRAEKKSN